MKTAIFITARMGSQRLPNKHFLYIKDQKMAINILLDTIYTEFAFEISNDLILPIIVTGNLGLNRRFSELTYEYNIPVFFGDDNNIPFRHSQAAKEYKIDSIIAIDGDDIMISRQAMRSVYQNLSLGADYTATSGLPLGMNVMGYSSKALLRVQKVCLPVLDTGWGFIFDCVDQKKISSLRF